MDIEVSIAMKNKHNTGKFNYLHDFRDNPIYSSSERAALNFAEELTLDKKISDTTFANAKKFFSERELVEIAWLVSTEKYDNLMNPAFDIPSDNLCEIARKPGAAVL